VTHAVARLRRQSILGVLGPSGVGKSSFVRAGLIPALRASEVTWEVVTLRPGRSPLASLGTALARVEMGIPPESLAARLETEPGCVGASLRNRANRTRNPVLLVVDQLEELFPLGAEPAERAAFLVCLAGLADDASAPVRLVCTLRSDFLDRVAENAHFTDELA